MTLADVIVIDFSTLADVIVMLDYTALDSADLRVSVVRELDRTRDGDRGFSLRQARSSATPGGS